MNRIDFNQTGGFPLSTQILDAGQKAYWILNQYAYFAGNNFVIITGCEAGAGGTVTDGYVVINGEPMPFKGTTATAEVIIVEIADSRGFEDGNVKPVIYERYATFGSGADSFSWWDFRRPKTLFQLEDEMNLLKQSIPVGLVAIWDKPGDEIPLGWIEHIPMRGNIPVGHNSGDINFGSLGNTVGTAQVTLDINQIPAHDHSYFDIGNNSSGGSPGPAGGYDGGDNRFHQVNRNTGSKGGGGSHTNIQPSRIVKYIQFVGF